MGKQQQLTNSAGQQSEAMASANSFPAYPAYKDSGVEWLGEVPEHWATKQLRYLGRFRKGLTITKADLSDVGVPCLNYGEVHSKYPFEVNQDIQPLRFIPESYLYEAPAAKIKLGDFVFADTSEDIAGVGNFSLVSGTSPLAAGYHTIIYTLVEPADCRFIAYCLDSDLFRKQLRLAVKGVKVFSITQEILRAGYTWFPPLDEQTQIARFLDHETARIDALIAEQQRLIELLKEKRQAVISHAVTKGLNPNVPMKDSGVEWLGQVPAHWAKKRLKNLSPFITVGIVVNPTDYVSEEGLPFLYGGEVKEGFIEVEKARKITLEDSKKNRKTMLEAGDIVTMRVGYPGLTAVVPPECEGGNCASVMLVKRGGYDSNWLCAVMNSRLVRQQVEVVQYGAAQKQFNISDAVEFWMFVPPKEEQTFIAEFINRQSSVFNSLIAEAEMSVQLLQERRAALISAAVTGKIDVRGWQPPVNAISTSKERETA